MNKTRGSLSLLLAGLLIAACSSIGPGTTIPPITIPSFTIPSFPPIVIPSIPLPPGFTLPPFELPSADPNSGICALISAQEVGTIMGGTVTVTENGGNSCTYTASNFTSVIVRTEAGSDLTAAKFLLGTTATDITIGPYPAVSGAFFSGPLVYIQRAGEQLVIQGVLTGDDAAAIAKIVQIAQTAGARW